MIRDIDYSQYRENSDRYQVRQICLEYGILQNSFARQTLQKKMFNRDHEVVVGEATIGSLLLNWYVHAPKICFFSVRWLADQPSYAGKTEPAVWGIVFLYRLGC